MFTAALSRVAKCPSTDEWIKKSGKVVYRASQVAKLASRVAQVVKNVPAMQEDTLEATYSSIHGPPCWQRIWLKCGRPGFNPWVGKIP